MADEDRTGNLPTISRMFSGSTSALAITGAALFWLWIDAAVFSGTLLDLGSDGNGFYTMMFLVTTLVTVVCFAIPLVVPGLIDATTLSRRWRLLSIPVAVCGIAGSVALLVAGSTASMPLVVAGSVLNGICFAHLNVLWGWVCVAQGHAKAIVHISAAWALGLPFNLLFAVLPPIASGVTVALLPGFSVMVYQMVCALQDKPVYRVEPQRREVVDVFRGHGLILGFDARLLALILVFCSIFGLMYAVQVVSVGSSDAAAGMSVLASGQGEGSSAGVIGVRGLTALVFLAASLTVLRDRVQLLFKCCFFILVAGLAVMVVGIFVEEFRALSPLMVAVGYCGFDILVWTMIAFHGYATHTPPAKTVIVAMLAEQAGIWFGALLGMGMQALGVSAAVETGIIMGLDLVALAVLMAYTEYGSRLWTLLVRMSTGTDDAFQVAGFGRVGDVRGDCVRASGPLGGAEPRTVATAVHIGGGDGTEGSDAAGESNGVGGFGEANGSDGADMSGGADGAGRADGAGGSVASAGSLDVCMARLAERYGLTRREQEMLGVFVQGRSMAYIAEKLFVSDNTVKTHIRHAYTKCGVHNKQEMIDLVESIAHEE